MSRKATPSVAHAAALAVADGRRSHVGMHIGDVFDPSEEYDGYVLQIEVRDAYEAEAIAAAITADGIAKARS